MRGITYAGALWVAYQTALLLGVGCFLFAGGSALTLLAAALIGRRRDTNVPMDFTFDRGNDRPALFPRSGRSAANAAKLDVIAWK